jgi:hypothetical protein
MGQRQNYQGRGQGLFQHDLQGIAIDRFQPLDIVSFPLHELLGPLDTAEELGHRHGLLGVQETGEGVDHIVRRCFPPMMKRGPPAQGEGPGAPIPGSLPKLGKGGKGFEVGIKLDQAVEELADDGAPIDIGQKGRIERGGIVAQHPAVSPPELRSRHVQLGRLQGFRHTGRAVCEQIATDAQGDQERHPKRVRHLTFPLCCSTTFLSIGALLQCSPPLAVPA